MRPPKFGTKGEELEWKAQMYDDRQKEAKHARRMNGLLIVLGLFLCGAIFASPWSIVCFGVCLDTLIQTAYGPYTERSMQGGLPLSFLIHAIGIIVPIIMVCGNWRYIVKVEEIK